MGIGTLVRYLIGDRRAILEIAADRRALWIGLVFVLSAGFAREYDGEDLTREPWHLLIPLGASLVSSFVLFVIVYGKVIWSDPNRPWFFAAYRSFLTLFWMTAPLALLYGIPYERFLSPVGAVEANLWTLGLVALWRVALMIRVVSVLLGYSVTHAFFLVLLFADTVSILAVVMMPKPVVSFMGGIRHTESEQLIGNLTCSLLLWSILLFAVWFIGALVALAHGRPAWQAPSQDRDRTAAPSRGLSSLALASLLIWLPFLPWTQAEQRLRFDAEHDLRAGRITEGLALMSAHAERDFPPLWEPPPRVGYGESKPPLLDVLEVIVEQPQAPWVQAVYLEKFGQSIWNRFSYYSLLMNEPDRITKLAQRLPSVAALMAENERLRDHVEHLLERKDLPQADKDALTELLRITARDAAGKDLGGKK